MEVKLGLLFNNSNLKRFCQACKHCSVPKDTTCRRVFSLTQNVIATVKIPTCENLKTLHVCEAQAFIHVHIRESTKHGPLVHGPPPWTGSMDRVHENMDRVHGPLSWTGSMDPLFLLPLKLLIRSKIK